MKKVVMAAASVAAMALVSLYAAEVKQNAARIESLSEEQKDQKVANDMLIDAIFASSPIDLEKVTAALEKGADPDVFVDIGPDALEADKYTPLMWAAFEGDAKSVNLLLDYGARAKAQSSKLGITPLHMAVLAQSLGRSLPLNALWNLLNAGADIDARAYISDFDSRVSHYMTPLMLSMQGLPYSIPSYELVAFLLKNGANPTIADEEGLDAFWYAKRSTLEIKKLVDSYRQSWKEAIMAHAPHYTHKGPAGIIAEYIVGEETEDAAPIAAGAPGLGLGAGPGPAAAAAVEPAEYEGIVADVD